jgi:argininosuccinate lyase
MSVDLEDVHLNIEARLIELAGDAGKRLHTAAAQRPVATDAPRCATIDTLAPSAQLQRQSSRRPARRDRHAGLTHQVAQPVSSRTTCSPRSVRDAERMVEVRARTAMRRSRRGCARRHQSPLDREAVAKALRMDGVCQNSIDAVSDRDFAIEFMSAASPVRCTSRV